MLALFLAGSGSTPARAQAALIRDLTPADASFRQLSDDVEDARRTLSRPGNAAAAARSLTVYSYTVKADDRLFAVAARCSLPYETIATANRIPASEELVPGRTILIPAVPGLFIPERAETDLERLMAAARGRSDYEVSIILRNGTRTERFAFLPGAEFSPTERAFFLNLAFRFPLPAARVTSDFGMRRNPLTGSIKLHEGIDLAAPEGTEVYAARDGKVAEIGNDPIYGRFVLIQHEGSWRSLYGHLSEVLTDLRKSVRSGTIIGRVGSTGQSTGPHLHFELRRDGEARDPAPLLPRGIRR